MNYSNRLAAANSARHLRFLKKKMAGAFSGARRGNNPKVRRDSQHASEHEVREWKRHNIFDVVERDARLLAIQEWNYREKPKGAYWGPLGPSGERFLDTLMGMRCYKTGRLDASIKAIASRAHMCVQTVTDYIKRLMALGLLMKIRRSQPIENPDPRGPQIEQITNAYWFQLPAEIAERVRQILSGAPKPVDQEEHERAQAEQLAEMISKLSCEDLAAFYAGDTSVLAKALASYGKAFDSKERDSSGSKPFPPTR